MIQLTVPKRVPGAGFRRVLGWLLLTFFVLLLLSVIFLGEIVERVIQKNDVKYTGREILLADMDINLIKGVFKIDRLRMLEANGEDVFFEVRGVIADIKPWRLTKKELYVEEVGLDQIIANVSHTNTEFNYDDLLDRFLRDSTTASDSTPDTTAELDWTWRLEDIHVDSCQFNYLNKVLDTRITVVPFNLISPLISSELDTFSLYSRFRLYQGRRHRCIGHAGPRQTAL